MCYQIVGTYVCVYYVHVSTDRYIHVCVRLREMGIYVCVCVIVRACPYIYKHTHTHTSTHIQPVFFFHEMGVYICV